MTEDRDNRGGLATQLLIGRYSLVRELGGGGFGVVYLANDEKLDRPVAIKMLRKELSQDREQLTRFEREARLLASLNHSGIGTIHSIEEDKDGSRFLVLEYVEGQTLQKRLEEGPLSLPEALAVCQGVAEAIEAAHEKNIIHRDLKPANVMVTAGGGIKVLDFGISRTQREPQIASDEEARTITMTGTASGIMMGTPGYMSPEQVRGEEIDKSADVFAFGCLLYECLSGRKAFGGQTPADAIASVLTSEPCWTALPQETPEEVRQLLAACLLKDRRQRMRDIRSARLRIEELARSGPGSPARLGRRPVNAAHNLPVPLTSFVGRVQEIPRVTELIEAHRFLTLVGVGGCGKTRLALEVADRALDFCPDGVWLVELAGLTSPNQIPEAIGRTMNVRQEAGVSLLEGIENQLRPKKLLLVLDNCEHLIRACGQVCLRLLLSCPHLKIMATSREALGLPGEITWSVPSLSLPTLPHHAAGSALSAQEALRSEAVSLFIERAKAVRWDFELTDASAPDVARICQRLDGIPLAIELAAARIKVLTVEQIQAKLSDRFRLLTGGSRTVLERHQTLQATIDWSYDLLAEEERSLFRSLSAFAGGRTLESATAVCRPDLDEYQVLDLLTHLVDKSLLSSEDREGETRYRMLESIRQYGQAKLNEAGEAPAIRDRHLQFFLGLGEKAESEVRGREQALWLSRLELEHANLLAALAWCDVAEGGAEKGLRLASALCHFWHVHGHFTTGRFVLMEALNRAGVNRQSLAAAKALASAGSLAWDQGDYKAARALHEESLVLRREFGDTRGVAASLNNLGAVAYQVGDYTEARECYEASLQIKRQMGDIGAQASSYNNLGLIAHEVGDYEGAIRLYDESLRIKRQLGDKRGIAATLDNQGMVALEKGDLESARALHEEALALEREVGDRWGIAASLHNLGTVAIHRDCLEEAETLFQDSLTIHRELRDKKGIAGALFSLAVVMCHKQDRESARLFHEQSLLLRREIGDKAGIAASLEAIAGAIFRDGTDGLAARLFGAADALREEIGTPLPPSDRSGHEGCIAAAREEIGGSAWEESWTAGRATRWEDAVEIALEHLGACAVGPRHQALAEGHPAT